MSAELPTLRIIIGPTASGKAKLAVRIAEEHGLDMISMDSMKVYRRMDIGTAKPSKEVQKRVRFHLIDIIEPSESYSVADWLSEAQHISDELAAAGRGSLFVGGTALYYKALTEGLFDGPGSDEAIRMRLRKEAGDLGPHALHARLAQVDPVAASRILPGDLRRIERALEVYELTGRPISSFHGQFGNKRTDRRLLILGLLPEREDCYRFCDARVDRMMQHGLLEEARGIYEAFPVLSRTAAQAVGYKEFFAHFRGEMSLPQAVEAVKLNTRHFARRQYMWFRKFTEVNWVRVALSDSPESMEAAARTAFPEFFEI
jgi:tRNA dimethylallyltransferase